MCCADIVKGRIDRGPPVPGAAGLFWCVAYVSWRSYKQQVMHQTLAECKRYPLYPPLPFADVTQRLRPALYEALLTLPAHADAAETEPSAASSEFVQQSMQMHSSPFHPFCDELSDGPRSVPGLRSSRTMETSVLRSTLGSQSARAHSEQTAADPARPRAYRPYASWYASK
jgi:hypothetical protein